MECIVCKRSLKDPDLLKSHMARHTKADLIKIFTSQLHENNDTPIKIKVEVNENDSTETVDGNFFLQNFEDRLTINDFNGLTVKTEVGEINVTKKVNNQGGPNDGNNNECLNNCLECQPKKKKKTSVSKKGYQQANKKSKIKKQVTMKPIRRSTRAKYTIPNFSPLSNQNIYLAPRKNDNMSNYYIPDFAKIKSLSEDDLENLENVNLEVYKKDSPRSLEPILKTPKLERKKSVSSDTETCSGNGTVYSVDEQIYCVYCGNGYKNTESLEIHLHKHLNFCIVCNIDFNCLSSYIEHLHSHTHKIYICQYCNAEYISKDVLNLHLKHHLEDNLINDVLTLETDFRTDRSQINQYYGYYNAGYEFAMSSADIKTNGSDFYKTFLQMNIDEGRHCYRHFYCQICLRNFSDGSIYSDHVRNYHF